MTTPSHRPPDWARITAAVAATGLACRGGFRPTAADGLPGNPAAVVLVGDGGGAFWPRFRAGARDEADPLDNWTRRVLEPVAADLGAGLLYPFDGAPHWPFQAWAMRAEGLKPSPIGPLMHPEFGPWHSYRAALSFAWPVDLPAAPAAAHPCDDCRDKPCLHACPVEAFGGRDFAVERCIGHLKSPAGGACLSGGCLARLACPVGRDHAYGEDHQAFLAAAFVASFGG